MDAARIERDSIPGPVRSLAARLSRAGHRAWIVGGCVRDLLMGRAVSDWDLATSALPRDVQRIFSRTIPTGIEHGTVTVLWEGGSYEVTTLRGEGAYSDGRRPDSVHFVGDIEEDLARRDFTVNAIALDPADDALIDPWGGLEDLSRRVLRAVRDPRERFDEDGLRALRAARFSATLEMELEPATEAAIAGALPTLAKVSPERVHDEWCKAMTKASAPSRAFVIMRRTGMLRVIAAPLDALDDEAFARAMRRIDAAPRDVTLRLAALLLALPARDDDALLRALRFSNQVRESVLHLTSVAALAPADPDAATAAQIRRYVHRVTRTALGAALELLRADELAAGDDGSRAARLRARCDAELGAPLEMRELAVRGDDVMRALGTSPGRMVGKVLARLLDEVLDDPGRNTREALLARVPELAAQLESSK